jgi:hypothetical protein
MMFQVAHPALAVFAGENRRFQDGIGTIARPVKNCYLWLSNYLAY